ncbi:MAG: nucleotide exchange factor GrpE [Acidimicrobiia bacterium]
MAEPEGGEPALPPGGQSPARTSQAAGNGRVVPGPEAPTSPAPVGPADPSRAEPGPGPAVGAGAEADDVGSVEGAPTADEADRPEATDPVIDGADAGEAGSIEEVRALGEEPVDRELDDRELDDEEPVDRGLDDRELDDEHAAAGARAPGPAFGDGADAPDDEGPPTALPQAADVAPEPSPVLASLLRLEHGVDELARLGQRNVDHVVALHGENQRLRAGEVAGSVAPLLRDVIRLHDDVLRLEGVCAPEAALDLGLVRKLVVDALDRWGVQAFEPAVGDPFDPTVHNGMARVETPEHLDGTVASVRRCGFRGEQGRVWRPADVDVFRTIDRQPAGPSAGEE